VRDGLPLDFVRTVAQGPDGFIWAGTDAGIDRFDGDEFVPWARDEIKAGMTFLQGTPHGVYGADGDGTRLFRMGAGGVEEVEVPPGIQRIWELAADHTGALWFVDHGGGTVHRFDGEAWTQPLKAPSIPRGVRVARPFEDGSVAVASISQVIWTAADGTIRATAAISALRDIELVQGRLLVLTMTGLLIAVAPDGTETVREWPGAVGYSLWQHEDTVWVRFGEQTLPLRASDLGDDGPAIPVGTSPPRRGLHDHEGNLWLPTSRGLQLFPEPRTAIWDTVRGTSDSGARFITHGGDRIWYSTWGGQGSIRLSDGLATTVHPDWVGRGPVCMAGDGVMWTLGAAAPPPPAPVPFVFMASKGDDVVMHPAPTLGSTFGWGCATTASGSVLFDLAPGIYETGAPNEPPNRVDDSPFPTGAGDRAVLLDSTGRTWLGAGTRVCSRQNAAEAWACDSIPGLYATDLAETSSGSIWVASRGGGVHRATEDGWASVGGAEELPSTWVAGIDPSPSGGLWLSGAGFTVRVVDHGESWTVVESANDGDGNVLTSTRSTVETPTGDRWTAGLRGVQRIPGAARQRTSTPPRIHLTSATNDGTPVALDVPARLAHSRSGLDLRVAAVTYRDRSRLRYRVRRSARSEWRDAGAGPWIRYPELPTGSHAITIEASTDGLHWSREPVRFTVSVPPAWYAHPLTLALAALGLFALGSLFNRVRTEAALRVERMRGRIAMDLHDEVGSSLGSIVLLAGAAEIGELSDADRRSFLERIGATAGEVSESLSDIVWALSPGSGTLGHLERRLREIANRLFPTPQPTALQVEFPADLDGVTANVEVVRAAQMICAEALHNVARHAEASKVTLALTRDGDTWLLTVTDDGVGVAGSRGGTSGFGLGGMQTRASAIGGTLRIGGGESGGTRVSLRFRVRPPEESPLRRALRAVRGSPPRTPS